MLHFVSITFELYIYSIYGVKLFQSAGGMIRRQEALCTAILVHGVHHLRVQVQGTYSFESVFHNANILSPVHLNSTFIFYCVKLFQSAGGMIRRQEALCTAILILGVHVKSHRQQPPRKRKSKYFS